MRCRTEGDGLSHLYNAHVDIQNTASITTLAEMRIDCTLVAVDTLVGGRSSSDRDRYEARGHCDSPFCSRMALARFDSATHFEESAELAKEGSNFPQMTSSRGCFSRNQ